jgi:hypothetical protein
VRDFWLLAGAFFICGATTNGLIGTHLIAACSDHGLSEVRGAGLLAAIGVFDVVGTICSGWLTDRFDPRWLLFWYYGLRGMALLGLNAALSHAGLGLAAFVTLLRPGLGGDSAADRGAGTRGVRPRAGGRGVRLGVRVPPVRRRLRGLGRRRQPHLVRVIRAGLPGRGRAGRDGGRAQPQRRPPRQPAPPNPVASLGWDGWFHELRGAGLVWGTPDATIVLGQDIIQPALRTLPTSNAPHPTPCIHASRENQPSNAPPPPTTSTRPTHRSATGTVMLRPMRQSDLPGLMEEGRDETTRRWVNVPIPYTEQHARDELTQLMGSWDDPTAAARVHHHRARQRPVSRRDPAIDGAAAGHRRGCLRRASGGAGAGAS